MNLHKLLNLLGVSVDNIEDCKIKDVCIDSRTVVPESVYVCLQGINNDGHDYAGQAMLNGACAVICERDLGIQNQVICSDTRMIYSKIMSAIYDNPQDKLIIIGVTGTNGKTTVSTMIKEILEHCGYKAGILGTIETRIGNITFPAKYTTPDPKNLYPLLDIMVREGCTHCVMEVSSHGLDQKRVAGLNFEVGVFTNLTLEHLDYHKNMENYYQAKKSLFNQCKYAVVNIDDNYGERLFKEINCICKTYSTRNVASLTAQNIVQSLMKTEFTAIGDNQIYKGSVGMAGEYGVSNSLAAVVACSLLNIPKHRLFLALSNYKGVSGRLEVLYSNDYTIIRDYAHTPDALEKLLTTLKQLTTGRLITLFGCAGDRDKGKRKPMAQIAEKFSDFVILTSDNPRTEDIMCIIEEIKLGFTQNHYIVIPNRYDAIVWGIKNAMLGDTLVLAGKGHENYQVLNYGTIDFDEKKIVRNTLTLNP